MLTSCFFRIFRYDTEMDAHRAVKQDLLVQVQVADWRQQQAAATIVSLQQQVQWEPPAHACVPRSRA